MDERQLSSPNLSGLDPFAYEPQRIEKPWGWELLWAESETYVGKLLFVRAGQALSLQFHNRKDESWYVYEGRAELEMGAPGNATRSPWDRRRGRPAGLLACCGISRPRRSSSRSAHGPATGSTASAS